ncbi:MAG: hypothetical protein U5M50_07095 [Sphingobium sp.]|nr:hypothetical protein [Sphingobium sp.]
MFFQLNVGRPQPPSSLWLVNDAIAGDHIIAEEGLIIFRHQQGAGRPEGRIDLAQVENVGECNIVLREIAKGVRRKISDVEILEIILDIARDLRVRAVDFAIAYDFLREMVIFRPCSATGAKQAASGLGALHRLDPAMDELKPLIDAPFGQDDVEGRRLIYFVPLISRWKLFSAARPWSALTSRSEARRGA